MGYDRSEVKRRIEEKYESEERPTDGGYEHAGQMTIAFCDYPTGPTCLDT